MAEVLYKKGYLVRVTTWENDGDNYNTKEQQVDTEEGMKELVAFCRLFSDGHYDKNGGIGNIYDPDKEELEYYNSVIDKFFEEHPLFFGKKLEHPEHYRDYCRGFAYDLGLKGGEFFTRVCDQIEVLHFDRDVMVEKVNV